MEWEQAVCVTLSKFGPKRCIDFHAKRLLNEEIRCMETIQ